MKSRDYHRRIVLGTAVLVCFVLGGGYLGVSLLTAERLTRPTSHPLAMDPRRVSEDAWAWSVRRTHTLNLRKLA